MPEASPATPESPGAAEARRETPLLLTIGLVLSVVKAGLALLFALGMSLVSLGLVSAALPVGLGEREPVAAFGLVLGGSVLAVVVFAYLVLQLLKLFVCWKAWRLERTWLTVLIVVAAISLVADLSGGVGCCALPMLVDVALVIGALQALSEPPDGRS